MKEQPSQLFGLYPTYLLHTLISFRLVPNVSVDSLVFSWRIKHQQLLKFEASEICRLLNTTGWCLCSVPPTWCWLWFSPTPASQTVWQSQTLLRCAHSQTPPAWRMKQTKIRQQFLGKGFKKREWVQTCCSSAGVENLAVTPLIIEAKEKEPTPYLETKTAQL